MTDERIAYKDLVFDRSLYPRTLMDEERVAHLRAVLDAGEALPPIVVDAYTRTVVDGYHRAHAHFARSGASVGIPCIRRQYGSRGDMLLDSIRLNAAHGLPLGLVDQQRVVAMARADGVTVEQIASVLSVQVSRVRTLTSKAAASPTTTQAKKLHAPGVLRNVGDGRKDAATVIGGAVNPPDYEPWRASSGLELISRLSKMIVDRDLDLTVAQTRKALRTLVEIAVVELHRAEAAA